MNKKNNVFIDERWLGNHGIGIVTKNLINGLNAKPLNINCDKFSVINPFLFSLKLFKLPPKAIIINTGFNNPFLFPRKYFFYIHDLIHINYYSSFFYKIYYKIYISFCIKFSTKVFTVSDFSKKQILNFFKLSENKVINVSNGVDESFFSKSKFKSFFNFKYLLCVANRKKHKNEEIIIKSFFKLKKTHKLKLVLIGKPSREQSKFIKDNNLLNDIIYLDDLTTNSMISLYRNAEAFITASFIEGFNLPLLEAMASKISIYASNIEVHRDITKGNVIYFNPDDVNSLHVQLLKNIHKKNSTQINNAYLIAKTYSWADVINRINLEINE